MIRTIRNSLRELLLSGIRALPDGALLAIRGEVKLRRPMDYAGSKIMLTVESPDEYHLRLHSAKKEPETVEWIEKHIGPGDVLYDIGANVGAYSLIAAQATQKRAKVYAFEPAFSSYNSLCWNVVLNECQKSITPLPIALSDVTYRDVFRYNQLTSGGASNGLSAVEQPTYAVTNEFEQVILAIRLDDLVEKFGFDPPTHIKMDVDGGEVNVLRGAAATLASGSVRSVLVELDAGSLTEEAVFSVLRDAGFTLSSEHSRPSGVRNCIFMRERAAGGLVRAQASAEAPVGTANA